MHNKPKIQKLKLDEILNYSSLLPNKEIKPAKPNHFTFEKERLPSQVKLLIEVTNPNSINSGSVIFHDEELFWISSALKLVLFNPNILTNVIEFDIDYPVQIIFSYNLYLILSHLDSFVTLLNFPSGFSQMFKNDETENFNYYNYTKNKANILNLNPYPKMLRPVPSSYHITSAQGNFIGCSDGVVRTFQVVGHWPDSNFFIKKAIYNSSSHTPQKKVPIISLKRSENFLYSLDASYNLTVYLILSPNQIAAIDAPLRIPGICVNMTPFKDSVILTKQKGNDLLVSSVLNSKNWYRVRKNGLIVSRGIKSDYILTKFDSTCSTIYSLNTLYQQIKNDLCVLWPVDSKRTLGNVVIIYLEYYNYKNEKPASNEIDERFKTFECKVKVGDIVVFAYNDFKPVPFIDMNSQFIPFSVIENKQNIVQFNYKVKKEIKKEVIEEVKSISLKTTEFVIHENGEGVSDEQNEKNTKKSCLCISGDYPICPRQTGSVESLFGIDSVTHSIWSSIGSLFCIIYSIQPNFGKLLTMQFGVNPVADFRSISGRIYGYTTRSESTNEIGSFTNIKSNTPESLFIFTSEGLITVSINNQTSYLQQVTWNSIQHLSYYWMKPATIKNLSDFRDMITSEFSFYPESEQIVKLIDKAQKNCEEEEIPSRHLIRDFIKNYSLIQYDIEHFVKLKNSPKQKKLNLPSRQSSPSIRRNSSSAYLISEQMELENDTIDLYKSFRKFAQKRDVEGIKGLVHSSFTVSTSSRRSQTDCLSLWIGDEINNCIGDEKLSAYVESLTDLQNDMFSFNRSDIIFE